MYSSIKVTSRPITKPDAHACFVFAGADSLHADDRALDKQFHGRFSSSLNRPEFKGEPGEVAVHTDDKGHRAIIIGLGDEKTFNRRTACKAAGRFLKSLDAMDIQSLSITVNGAVTKRVDEQLFGRAFGEGLGLASFTFTDYKSSTSNNTNKKNNAGKSNNKKLTVHAPTSKLTSALSFGINLADSTNFARHLAATPPNIATPLYIAKQANTIARKSNGSIKCTIIKGAALKEKKLTGLVTVGKASENKPCLIRLSYTPKKKSTKTVMLVGKTVTYDTGGLSLKISNGMKGMKYDKCGGMAVLGAMHAIAWLKPNWNVVAYLPAAENSVAGNAYRPDDIIRFLNGVSVEVTNTDAEGRLVLADGLAFGCKFTKPTVAIDLATLTGGIVVALGKPCAGFWCEDETLRNQLNIAADSSGERIWRMPLYDEYREMMKSKHADIWNSAPVRDAHPVQGAAFLSYFVDKDLPWAHIDIAGAAIADKTIHPLEAGPTGFGVRLLAYYLENL